MELRLWNILLLFICLLSISNALIPEFKPPSIKPVLPARPVEPPPAPKVEPSPLEPPSNEPPSSEPPSSEPPSSEPPTPNEPTVPKSPASPFIPPTGNNLPLTPQDPTVLGQYSDRKQTPFSIVEGDEAWDDFFKKVDDILLVHSEDEASQTPDGNNEPNGHGNNGNSQRASARPITFTAISTIKTVDLFSASIVATSTYTSIFDPTQPTEACLALASLSAYCGNGGTSCACYSSSYYVPEQWNSLAAGCARFACPTTSVTGRSLASSYCAIARHASSSTSYCSATNVSSTAFGAVAPPTGLSTSTDSASKPIPSTDSGTKPITSSTSSFSSPNTPLSSGAEFVAATQIRTLTVALASFFFVMCIW